MVSVKLPRFESIRCESSLVKPNRFTGSRYSWYTSMRGVKLLRFESIRSIRCESNLVSRIALPEVDIPGIQVWGCEFIAIRVDSIDSLRIGPRKFDSFRRKSICMHVLGV